MLFLNYLGRLMSYVQLQLLHPNSDCWAGPTLPSGIYDFDPKEYPPSSAWGWLTTTEPWAERSQITFVLPISHQENPMGQKGSEESHHDSSHSTLSSRPEVTMPTQYFVHGSPCLISQTLSLLLHHPCSSEIWLAVWGVGLKQHQLETESHRTVKSRPGKKSRIR